MKSREKINQLFEQSKHAAIAGSGIGMVVDNLMLQREAKKMTWLLRYPVSIPLAARCIRGVRGMLVGGLVGTGLGLFAHHNLQKVKSTVQNNEISGHKI